MISLAFAILLSGGISGFNSGFFIVFIIAFLTAGLGFLLHELMHKYFAQKYKLWAEFRANYKMLLFAIAVAFFGFIFAAPGAVYIKGATSTRQNGKISLAGPVTNIILALIFLVPVLIYNQGILGVISKLGLTINSLLAAFNMIPVMPFDGAKVIKWDKKIYTITTVIAVGLFILSWFI